jgi:hypothetical protein
MREPLGLSITMHSEHMTPTEMIDVVGLTPTSSQAKGAPISSRNPSGKKRRESILRFEAAKETDWDINNLVEELRPVIERLSDLRGTFDSTSIWLMAHGRPMGAWITLLPESMRLIADAGLQFELDMYCSEECCQDEDNDLPGVGARDE